MISVHQSPLDGTGAISRGNSRSSSIISVGPGIPRSSVCPLDEPLPALRRSHLDTQMDGFGVGIPGHMGNSCGSDDDLARHGDPLDTIDAKAHAAGDELPALLHLEMDVLQRAVPRLSPKVLHLQQPPSGIGRDLQEHKGQRPQAGRREAARRTPGPRRRRPALAGVAAGPPPGVRRSKRARDRYRLCFTSHA